MIRSALDGTVVNAGVPRYRSLSGRHLRPVSEEALGPDSTRLVVETVSSDITVAMAARLTVTASDPQLSLTWDTESRPGWIGQTAPLLLRQDVPVTLEKLVAVCTSHDRGQYCADVAAAEDVASAGSFASLSGSHIAGWERLWDQFPLDIAGGSGAVLTLRLHLFHLLQTASPHVADLDVSVPARGLHGEAYRGHIFWDELFVLPSVATRLPAVARSLLRYRHRRLDRARRAAREAGFAGAMFPWQSGSDGREESQQFHLNPVSGHWLPDATWRQRHIGAAIAHNVWSYHQATGDHEFLCDHGAEMILDIARFWSSAAAFEPQHGRYAIRGVVGPDEFHTGYPGRPGEGIDNNAYTNVMAAATLTRAFAVLEALPHRRRDELTERLELTPAELDRWDDISRRLAVPFHDDVISQFEGYDQLAELDWDAYRARYGDIRRLDRILEAEGDCIDRYRASKQADALMLFYLLSAEELSSLLVRLGYRYDRAAIPCTVDYYLARTSHGSTLSAVVHAWVLARSRRTAAFDWLVEGLNSDVADVQGGTTAEGVHLGAMAGTLDLVQRCFAGIAPEPDGLRIEPVWPAALGPARFGLTYQGRAVEVRLAGDHVRVTVGDGPGPPVRILSRGRVVEVTGPEEVELSAWS